MRADGKLVTNVSSMYLVAPYIMRRRSDSMNMIEIETPYDNIHQYVLEQRKQGRKISHMAIVYAAYCRTVSQFPALNRFVVHSRVYARNELAVAMVVLRPGDENETMGKIKFDINDTIFDVNDKLNKYVEDNDKSNSNNSFDDILRNIACRPLIIRPIVNFLMWLDKIGLLPKSAIDASPFHESMVFTNLASIKTNYIFHHVYDFGTCSMILAMGNTIETPQKVNGEVVLKKMIPFGLVMDERIASGYYYAQAFAELKKYLENPALLETPPTDLKYDFPFPTLSARFPSKKEQKAQRKAAKKTK